MSDNPRVNVPPLCRMHQRLLVVQARYGPADPWRSLFVATDIALFQAVTADPRAWERMGDDVTRLGELGCLACYKPDRFGEIVEAAKTHDLGAIKTLGESWVKEGSK